MTRPALMATLLILSGCKTRQTEIVRERTDTLSAIRSEQLLVELEDVEFLQPDAAEKSAAQPVRANRITIRRGRQTEVEAKSAETAKEQEQTETGVQPSQRRAFAIGALMAALLLAAISGVLPKNRQR